MRPGSIPGAAICHGIRREQNDERGKIMARVTYWQCGISHTIMFDTTVFGSVEDFVADLYEVPGVEEVRYVL